MELNFTSTDFSYFVKVAKEGTMGLLLIIVFFILIIYFYGDEFMDVGYLKVKVWNIFSIPIALFSYSFRPMILDAIFKKKMVYRDFLRLEYDAGGGEIGNAEPYLRIPNVKTIYLTGFNRWVEKSEMSESPQMFEIEVTKYSDIILTIRKLTEIGLDTPVERSNC